MSGPMWYWSQPEWNSKGFTRTPKSPPPPATISNIFYLNVTEMWVQQLFFCLDALIITYTVLQCCKTQLTNSLANLVPNYSMAGNFAGDKIWCKIKF